MSGTRNDISRHDVTSMRDVRRITLLYLLEVYLLIIRPLHICQDSFSGRWVYTYGDV